MSTTIFEFDEDFPFSLTGYCGPATDDPDRRRVQINLGGRHINISIEQARRMAASILAYALKIDIIEVVIMTFAERQALIASIRSEERAAADKREQKLHRQLSNEIAANDKQCNALKDQIRELKRQLGGNEL